MRFSVQLGLVLLSASALPLCFPPFGWWPLMLAVLPLLFFATSNTTPRRAFYLGMLHGTVGYGATLYWFFHIFAAGAIPLFAILALFTAVFCLLFNFLTKQTKSAGVKVLMAATLWAAIEFYRSELFFLRFPWITPGSALGPTWLSPIVGVYGASFLVAAASAALIFRRTLPLGLFLSLTVVCLGLLRPAPLEADEGARISVAVVQSEDCLLRSYASLTRKAQEASPDLVVWPEYSLPYDVRKDEKDFAKLTSLCADLDAILVVGTQTVVGPGARDWYNTALVLNKSGVLGEYYKARPVHFFNDGIPGCSFVPIQTGLGALGTPICFDCDYTEVARRMAAHGAEYFAVPSFDAESWSANQHLQHAALFKLRAAENARWLACAASSGVSQIIDPHGSVHKSLPPMETGVLTYRIGKSDRITFFTRAGWLLPWVTVVCSICLLIYAFCKALVERRRKAEPSAVRDGEEGVTSAGNQRAGPCDQDR